jgi:hypothetical protein
VSRIAIAPARPPGTDNSKKLSVTDDSKKSSVTPLAADNSKKLSVTPLAADDSKKLSVTPLAADNSKKSSIFLSIVTTPSILLSLLTIFAVNLSRFIPQN